jgi:hypothetical protein
MLGIVLTTLMISTQPLQPAQQMPAMPERDCIAQRQKVMKSTKPSVNPRATFASRQDTDPATVEMWVIADLPESEMRVSNDGQIIYLSDAVFVERADETTDKRIGRLIAEAIDHRLALEYGPGCPALDSPVLDIP